MLEPKDRPALSREALLAFVAELQRQLAELCASNEALHVDIDQLKHDGKRQAAPFSRGTRVPDPKLPGRKPGSGTFRYREAPPPEAALHNKSVLDPLIGSLRYNLINSMLNFEFLCKAP